LYYKYCLFKYVLAQLTLFLKIGCRPLGKSSLSSSSVKFCGVFAWAAYIAFERNEDILPWVFIVLAIIFNPILKIHFPKEMWVVQKLSQFIVSQIELSAVAICYVLCLSFS
jgi:hypothetical protein